MRIFLYYMQTWKNYAESSLAVFASGIIYLCDRFPDICKPIVCISALIIENFFTVNSHNTIAFNKKKCFDSW